MTTAVANFNSTAAVKTCRIKLSAGLFAEKSEYIMWVHSVEMKR